MKKFSQLAFPYVVWVVLMILLPMLLILFYSLTTQGNEKFNYNNHPFYGHADKNFAFAHNGVLYNDIEVRKEKHLPKTKIETDSYVAVQLIEQQGKLKATPHNCQTIKNMI